MFKGIVTALNSIATRLAAIELVLCDIREEMADKRMVRRAMVLNQKPAATVSGLIAEAAEKEAREAQ
jgi:hypothetical protein